MRQNNRKYLWWANVSHSNLVSLNTTWTWAAIIIKRVSSSFVSIIIAINVSLKITICQYPFHLFWLGSLQTAQISKEKSEVLHLFEGPVLGRTNESIAKRKKPSFWWDLNSWPLYSKLCKAQLCYNFCHKLACWQIGSKAIWHYYYSH